MAQTALTAYKAGLRDRKRARAGRRSHQLTIPIAVVAGFGPIIADSVQTMKDPNQGVGQLPHVFAWHLAGYNTWDKSWSFDRMAKGWAPIVAGLVAHKLANRFGINAMLARNKVPLIRI